MNTCNNDILWIRILPPFLCYFWLGPTLSWYLSVNLVDWDSVFFLALYLDHLWPFQLLYFSIKLVSDERSAFAEFEYLKFINLKQTFIITKFTINKSYRICYVVKSWLLDWDSYAIPLGSGRDFSTYLVQSMKHFEIFSWILE